MGVGSSEIQVRIVDSVELASNLAEYAEKTSLVASNGFGLSGTRDAEHTAQRLQRYPNLVMAEKKEEVVGFQAYTLRETTTECYLYYLLAVKRAVQRQGIGRSMLSAAIQHSKPTLVGGRTQNPATLLSFARTMKAYGTTEIFPLAQGQASEILAADLPTFLAIQGLSDVVNQSGLSKETYTEGRLGDYIVRQHDPVIQTIDTRLQEIGLNRHRGDAVFFFARVAPSKIDATAH